MSHPELKKRDKKKKRAEFHQKYSTFSRVRERIYKRDNYICAYCGVTVITPSYCRKLATKKQEEKFAEFEKGLITKKEYLSFNRYSNSNFHKMIKELKIDKSRIGTIDHKIPLSKGGTSEDDNLVTCCLRCNSKKGEKIIKGGKV